jgi:hypothetical protein
MNNLEIIASADDYWSSGVESISELSGLEFEDVIDSYAVELVQGFIDKQFRLEDIRRMVQIASKSDGEATKYVSQQAVEDITISADDWHEFRCRRVAHHSLRKTSNAVRSRRALNNFLMGRSNLQLETSSLNR